jgi:hypothetical protein
MKREDATFPVICVNVNKAFLALAFSPSDPKNKWKLQIDQSYFGPSKYNKIGILRHEIGHILGYRHEQIAAPAEDNLTKKCNWKTEANTDEKSIITLTDYDPQSVMHYYCGVPAGPVLFEFSQKDIEGHHKLYGTAGAERPEVGAGP